MKLKSKVKIVALTGSPGVGKSTVAEILRERGYDVRKVDRLAEKHNCIIDEYEDEKVIDIEKLKRKFKIEVSTEKGVIIVEGHLSHLLDPDVVVVLRCNPLVLKRRLKKKGWTESKILENTEAELIDYILIESMELGKKIYEVDTTSLDPSKVADIVEEIIKENSNNYKPGKIDWISELKDDIEKVIRK